MRTLLLFGSLLVGTRLVSGATIPSTIATTEASATALNIESSDYTGTIPTEIGELTNLKELRVGDNTLTGSLPSELGRLTGLTKELAFHNQLDSANNGGLSGTIPTEVGRLTILAEKFKVYQNALTGDLPTEIGLLTNMKNELNFYDNAFASLPSQLGQ